MSKYNQYPGPALLAMLGVLSVLTISGCSTESDKVSRQNKSTVSKASDTTKIASELSYFYDHPHDETITDMEKHRFQHQLADQCVEREISIYPEAQRNRKSLERTCMCIADYMMKDLTAVEAEKFLKEKKNTQSLRIRYNNATYFCAKK